MSLPEIIIPERLRQYSSIVAGFTTRHWTGGLADRMGKFPRSVTLKQVHSDGVVCCHGEERERRGHPDLDRHASLAMTEQGFLDSKTPFEGDALVTSENGILLNIRTADCVPILIYDPVCDVVAAIHAGWRGIVAGVIERTFERLQKTYSVQPETTEVAIGPAICADCFEIGPEVAERFEARFGSAAPLVEGKGDRVHADLVQSCERILGEAGIKPAHCEALRLCTFCRADLFYSYRREGPETGRLIAFIGKKKGRPTSR